MGAKKNLEILGNCNYAVELGKKINLVLVGIEGNDIREGNRTLTLGLIWQLMRKYTLTLLAKLSPDGTPIVETEIITWANQRLEGKGVNIRHFGVRISYLRLWVTKFKKFRAEKLLKSNDSPKKFREIAFLAVLNFFPVQKLIFGHFLICKKWIWSKKIREIDLCI